MTLVVDQGPWRWHRSIGHIALSSSCVYCAPIQVDVQLNSTMLLISVTLRSTPLPWLPVLSNIEPPGLRRKAATDKLVEKIVKHDSLPIQPILSPPLLRLTSGKPLWLDLQPVDINSRWRHNWKSAQVVNSHLACDPTKPGSDLPRQQWSLLNRFHTEPQGHCGTCRRKWRLADTDLVLAGRLRRCPTLSNPILWQSWMAAYTGCTLQVKTLFPGWPIMVHDMHTRRRSKRRVFHWSMSVSRTISEIVSIKQLYHLEIRGKGHWIWCRLIDHIRLTIGLPLYI